MEKFTVLRGIPALLEEANISTDAIIPSIWAIKPNVDLGEKLFANWRYDETGAERPEFVLNQPDFRKASILVCGPNFGCGSSRETAVWALRKFGVRCLIGTSFGEIFRENLFKNGLLPIVLEADRISELKAFLARRPGEEIVVDLAAQTILLYNNKMRFDISSARREMLLDGLQDIDLARRSASFILSFEHEASERSPWLYSFF
jgi:3-isopropylmalate/(R)-2-methylmalate dehydratase small subunit